MSKWQDIVIRPSHPTLGPTTHQASATLTTPPLPLPPFPCPHLVKQEIERVPADVDVRQVAAQEVRELAPVDLVWHVLEGAHDVVQVIQVLHQHHPFKHGVAAARAAQVSATFLRL